MIEKSLDDRVIRRKIQQVGGGTIIVSLPKKWVEAQNIGKKRGQNNEILFKITPQGDLLLTSPQKSFEENPNIAKILLKNDVNHVKRLILAAYLDGYHEIHVYSHRSISEDTREEIFRLTAKILNGYEILGEAENTIIIQRVMNVANIDVHELIPKFKERTIIMLNELRKVLKANPDFRKIQYQIHRYEDILDRNYFLLLRILYAIGNNISLSDTLNIQIYEVLDYFEAIKALESIGDLIVEIIDNILEQTSENSFTLKKSITSLLDDLIQTTLRLINQAIQAFITHDHNYASKIIDERARIKTTRNPRILLLLTEQKEMLPYVLLFHRNLEKMVTHASRIAEAAINISRKEIKATTHNKA